MKAWADGFARQARRAIGAAALGICGLLAACGGGSGADTPAQAPLSSAGAAAAGDDSVELLAGVPALVAAPRAKIAAVATPGAPATSLRVHYRRADGNMQAGRSTAGTPRRARTGTTAGTQPAAMTSASITTCPWPRQRHGRLPAAQPGQQGQRRRRPELCAAGRCERDLAPARRQHQLHQQSAAAAGARHQDRARALQALRRRLQRLGPAPVEWQRAERACSAGRRADRELGPARRVERHARLRHRQRRSRVRHPRAEPAGRRERKGLEFIIHGMPPNENDKDGRDNNIRVEFSALTVQNQVGHIWLVERDATVYTAPPDLRQVSSTDARAVWLNKSLVKWPRMAAVGGVRLYHSATGQISVAPDAPVQGADGYIRWTPSPAPYPPPMGCASSTSAAAPSSACAPPTWPPSRPAPEAARARAGRRQWQGAERHHRADRRRAGRPLCRRQQRARPGRRPPRTAARASSSGRPLRRASPWC